MGSSGAVRGPPALSPATPARSGCRLKAWLRRGLIITWPPAQPHSHSHPSLGRKGRGSWLGGDLGFTRNSLFGPSRDRCLLRSLSTPFMPLFFPSSLPAFHASPSSELSPPSHLRSDFGRLTEGPGRTNFLCLEPDWTGFPFPGLRECASLLPTVLADLPEGDRA